jgi:serine palmitoyltransferase
MIQAYLECDRLMKVTDRADMNFAEAENNDLGTGLTASCLSTTTPQFHKSPRQSRLSNTILEGIAFSKVFLKIRLREYRDGAPYKSLTAIGRFNHYIVYPLSNWYGLNKQVLITAPLEWVDIQEKGHSFLKVINGGAHNYAGFYQLSMEEQELHQMCLEQLPIADTSAVVLLHEEMLARLAAFFGAKWCFSTPTGFQSNILAISAIAEKGWLVVLDEKAHNSSFSGTYAAEPSAIKKFKHNDQADLRRILQDAREHAVGYTGVLVVVEGLYR